MLPEIGEAGQDRVDDDVVVRGANAKDALDHLGEEDARPAGVDPPAAPDPDLPSAAAVDPATVRFTPVARPNGKPVPVNGTDVPVPQQVRTRG